MRGKRAKKLRRMAEKICTEVLNIDLMEGYNVYNQGRNCVGFAPATRPDGSVMTDVDGTPLITVKNDFPGTITTAWKLRTLYQNLKRRYKNGFIQDSSPVDVGRSPESDRSVQG